MLTPQKRVLLIVAISLAIALVFIFLLIRFLPHNTSKIRSVDQQTQTTSTFSEPTASEQQLAQEQTVRTQSAGEIAFAKLFVERYGSYSNESNFQNVRDVIPLMSATFAQATQTELATKSPPTGFFGITTHVISVKVIEKNEQTGTARVLVSTQREESKDTAQNVRVYYQDAELALVKEAGIWKVDSLIWR